jgi:hypothetical protein
MLRFFRFALLALLVVCFAGGGLLQAQALSDSYVSGGTFIYKVSGASVSVVLNQAGANFESLAIGPDWADKDAAGNAAHPFLLYACDTARHLVIRFDPANAATIDTIYNNGVAGLTPVCGRSSAAGEFFVTNKGGAGVYRFSGVAKVALGTLGASSPTLLPSFPAGMTGGGITQKNTADLLAVDAAENKVLRAGYGAVPSYSAVSTFASSSLSAPVGIARFSNGDVFVSNSVPGSGKNGAPIVAHFASSGAAAGVCSSLSAKTNETPAFVGSAQNDVLYLVTEANNSSTVWNWSASLGSCALVSQASVPTKVSGIAVPPVASSTISAALTGAVDPNATPFFFNAHAFQIEASGCKAQVTAYPMSPAEVTSLIGLAGVALPNGATPANNLGEGGYSIAYVAKWAGCNSIFADGQFVTSIFGLFDNAITNNPRIIRCEGSSEPLIGNTTVCEPVNAQSTLLADYPLGGIIPQDLGTTIRTPSNSTFVLVNANSGPNTNEPGTFCGYQTPLVNTQDPNQAAVFNAGAKNTLSVKFKLASAAGSCQNGNYITNAVALISVAQLTDSKGNAAFHPVNIVSTSVGLADAQPLFNTGNQQYQFTLNLAGYASGVYSLTTTFVGDNTSSQTIVFKIK